MTNPESSVISDIDALIDEQLSGGPVERRFWSKVNRTGDCWLWMAGRTWSGYGQFRPGPRNSPMPAHKFSYELLVRPVPRGLVLDHRHTCPKHCVNPGHLRVVTRAQNNENRLGLRTSNTSGVHGVDWVKDKRKWRARVKYQGKEYLAGYFPQDQLAKAEAAVVDLRNQLFTHNDIDRGATS